MKGLLFSLINVPRAMHMHPEAHQPCSHNLRLIRFDQYATN